MLLKKGFTMSIEFYQLILFALFIRSVPIVKIPFRMLSTYIHELGHGFMAILMFGSIKKITLNYDGSGACQYNYKNAFTHFLITLFGYITTSIVGYYMYYIAKVESSMITVESIYFTLGFIAMSILLWVKDIKTFILVLSIALIFSITVADQFTNLFDISSYTLLYVQFIGTYVMIDAFISPLHLIDGKDDGDGASLAQRTGIPEGFWIVLWLSIASYFLYKAYIL